MARISPTSASHSTFLQSRVNGLIVPIPRHTQNAVGKRLTTNQKNGEVFEASMRVNVPLQKQTQQELTASEVDSSDTELDNILDDGLDDEVQSEEPVAKQTVAKKPAAKPATKAAAKRPTKPAAKKTTGRSRSADSLEDLV